MGVEHVKEERVQRIREKYRKLAINWLSSNFPGFFSKNCNNDHFPTAEFLSLDGFTPFDEHAYRNRDWRHWSNFFNINDNFETWVCESAPSLRFSLKAMRKEKLSNHMTIALRGDTLSEKDLNIHGGDSITSRTYFANERLIGIISRYALASYLRELLRYIKESRQSLSGYSEMRHTASDVERISAFFRRSVGVPSIAREVSILSKNDASFEWNVTNFTQQTMFKEEKSYNIKDGLKNLLGHLSHQLLEEDRDTREFLNQLSSAIGTKESIAAQRRMEFIGWSALIVAILSMTVAAISKFGD